ncbi:hypothetical protein SAMN05216474_1133 [Lishizhenia tianjinensis]|uniref:YARHG domain-containing protein n=1 Tax=Lishizhenia tianjinensis TaxID=477690 RepID=A0A1I6YSY4_9FLAO|nr:hypothetical protein [Lishizhenia tianjinensis]SFT53341.1 hypothetical protein SAMN05216474_1133 [Lishizhenia tianjinensis]
MKQIILSICLLLTATFYAQTVKVKTQVGDLAVVYHTNDQELNGAYLAKYPNKNTKVQGYYEANKRQGAWYFYAEDEALMFIHVYAQGVLLKSYYSEAEYQKAMQEEMLKAPFPPHDNNSLNQLEKLPTVVEENIIWTERLWRTIELKDNPALLGNQILQTLLDNVAKDSITAYSAIDDEFTTPLEGLKLTEDTLELVGFRIKEDWFYDTLQQQLNFRIVGIAPLLKNNNKTYELCWFYYNEIRSVLHDLSYVKNGTQWSIDHFFTYYNYSGSIDKFSNKEDKSIAEMASSKKEKQSLEDRIAIQRYTVEEIFMMESFLKANK